MRHPLAEIDRKRPTGNRGVAATFPSVAERHGDRAVPYGGQAAVVLTARAVGEEHPRTALARDMPDREPEGDLSVLVDGQAYVEAFGTQDALFRVGGRRARGPQGTLGADAGRDADPVDAAIGQREA